MHKQTATKAAYQLQIPGSYIPFLRPSRHSALSYVVQPKAGASPFPQRHYATPFLEALDCYDSQWKKANWSARAAVPKYPNAKSE